MVRNLTYKTIKEQTGRSYLRIAPEFLAKNQRHNVSRTPFRIPPLTAEVGRDRPDRTLCPVRALRFYVKRTGRPALRRDRKKLFLPLRESNNREISAATISRWLKSLILMASALAGESRDLRRTLGISAHEIRALSTSYAFEVGASLDSILNAGRWSSHSCFSAFYLRICVELADGMCAIGPVVAAQQVCYPPLWPALGLSSPFLFRPSPVVTRTLQSLCSRCPLQTHLTTSVFCCVH